MVDLMSIITNAQTAIAAALTALLSGCLVM